MVANVVFRNPFHPGKWRGQTLYTENRRPHDTLLRQSSQDGLPTHATILKDFRMTRSEAISRAEQHFDYSEFSANPGAAQLRLSIVAVKLAAGAQFRK